MTAPSLVMPVPSRVAGHRITWWVWAGDQKMRRTSKMRGAWGCDASCSCGWETRTGGAVRSSIESEIWQHKWDVVHGHWEPES